MLSLTRKTDYALISLTHLAKLDKGETASAREIADLYELPKALLMNILKQLCHAGMIESMRGARGGYQLAHHPSEISVLDTLIAMEGRFELTRCCRNTPVPQGECGPNDKGCPISCSMKRLHAYMRLFLQAITLERIVDHDVDGALADIGWNPPGDLLACSNESEEQLAAAASSSNGHL